MQAPAARRALCMRETMRADHFKHDQSVEGVEHLARLSGLFPPFRGSGKVLSKEKIRANYDYFLEQKAARLDHLAKYLMRFSIELCWRRRRFLLSTAGSTATAVIFFPAEAGPAKHCSTMNRLGPASTTA